MTYSSHAFLFYFLLVLLVFSFLTKSLRVFWLIITSIVWIMSWNPFWGALYLSIVIFNYFFLHLLKNLAGKKRNNSFLILLLINFILFIFLKTGRFLGSNFDTPFGVSFFMFIIFAYVMDLWRTEKPFAMESFTHFIIMPLFFPLLMGGPIVRAKEFIPQLKNKLNFSFINLTDGLLVFAYGYCKIYFISRIFEEMSESNLNFIMVENAYSLIFFGFLATLHAYVDFSSYCDMGRGVAKCFGIDLNINFRAFYYSKNPNEFWQRWNITLGTWIRDYISFPMMLKWGRRVNHNLMLLLAFFLVGLWHGVTLNWILFGFFNGLLVISFNWFNKKFRLQGVGRIFAIMIFVGNGLLQDLSWFSTFKENMGHISFWSLRNIPWSIIFNIIPSQFFIALAVLLGIELFQENNNDVDWFTKKNLKLKTFLVCFFIIWRLYGLNKQMIFKNVLLPPAYFRI